MKDRIREIQIIRNTEGKNYYRNIKYPEIPLSSEDIYVLKTVGDRLDSLAYQFYNDIRLWWIIAVANPQKIRRDSYVLRSNLEIRIPRNIPEILDSFNDLNR